MKGAQDEFLMVATNPQFSSSRETVQFDSPFDVFTIYELDEKDMTMREVEFDNFR